MIITYHFKKWRYMHQNTQERSHIVVNKSRKFIVLRACRQGIGYTWKIISSVFTALFIFLALEFAAPHNTQLYDTTTQIKAIKKINSRRSRSSIKYLNNTLYQQGQIIFDSVLSLHNTALFILNKANLSVGIEVYLLNYLKSPNMRDGSDILSRKHHFSIVVEPKMLNGLRFYAHSTNEVAVGLDVSGIIFKELIKKIVYPDKLGQDNILSPEFVENNYVNLKNATEGINTNLNRIHSNLINLEAEIKHRQTEARPSHTDLSIETDGNIKETRLNIDHYLSNLESTNIINPSNQTNQPTPLGNEAELAREGNYQLFDIILAENLDTMSKSKFLTDMIVKYKEKYEKAPLTSQSRDLLGILWNKRHHLPIVRIGGNHTFFIHIKL